MGRWVCVKGWTIEWIILYSEMTTQGSCISAGVLHKSVIRHHLSVTVCGLCQWAQGRWRALRTPDIQYILSAIESLNAWDIFVQSQKYCPSTLTRASLWFIHLFNQLSPGFCLCLHYLLFWLSQIWPALKAKVNRCPNLCPACDVLRSKDGLGSLEWLGYIVDRCISHLNGIYASPIQSWFWWSLGHL